MAEAATFQQAFGALLAGHAGEPLDPSLARALTVHRNTSTKAALDALSDNYPVVRALLGEDAFTAVALDHVGLHPPADPRLCLYGETFAATVRAHPALSTVAFAADVAAVERMVVEALFAADAEPLDPAAMTAGIDLDTRLALHPATRRAAFATPAVAIWRAHQGGAPEHVLGALDWRPEIALVARVDEEVMVQAIDRSTEQFLDRLAAGDTLGEAAAAIDPAALPATFSTILASGAVVRR